MNQKHDKPGFEISPPPIPAGQIKETFKTDVVVVGAGISGLTAAASASEAGARVILLEKGSTVHYRGLHNAALASRLQKKAGITVDKDNVIYTIMEFAAYRNDQKVVKTWADNCDRAMDWLLDMAGAAGIEVIIDPTTKPWYFPNYPIIHVFRPKRQETLAGMLQDFARAHGAEIMFDTPAVRLIRQGEGRVTGVIAQNSSGEYLQFNAGKAVVLCTGDYGNDMEMVIKYCRPAVHDLKVVYEPAVNTGDGHKMGLWVGAAMDDIPHCAMIWDFATFCGPSLFNLARQPWLYVNQNGERSMNEDLPYGYECNQIIQQPGTSSGRFGTPRTTRNGRKCRASAVKTWGRPLFSGARNSWMMLSLKAMCSKSPISKHWPRKWKSLNQTSNPPWPGIMNWRAAAMMMTTANTPTG
jgi:fumarate reductase flavoprotein subunit